MKKLSYFIECIDHGVNELGEPVDVSALCRVERPWSEANEEIAKREADNIDEIEIVDDGQPEPEAQATTDDVLNALLGVTV